MRKEIERVGFLTQLCCEGKHHGPVLVITTWIALEHICWDPKDGELCLNRVKPGETLVEARRHSDVQIDVQIWV